MPHIDARSGDVVIRIVYDGAPEAGKTTNVAKLGTLMSLQRVGAAKKPGTTGDRTEFFDWLDFSGGYLDGRRVRCQLVSVPGQSSLLHRRKYLLEKADAIVFVADSRRGMFDNAIHNFATTVRMVERLGGPVPIGVILQANKQDMPEALSPAEVARQIGTSPLMPIIGSAASRGDGVMQTFILAVRLATDRVRALLLGDDMAGFEQDSETPEALFAAMLELEKAVVASSGDIPAGIGTPAVESPTIEIIAIDDGAGEEEEEGEDPEVPARSIEIAARHAAEAGLHNVSRRETKLAPRLPPPPVPPSGPEFVDTARAASGGGPVAGRREPMKIVGDEFEAAWDDAILDDNAPAANEQQPRVRAPATREPARHEQEARALARTRAARLPPLPELPTRIDSVQAARERAVRHLLTRDLAAYAPRAAEQVARTAVASEPSDTPATKERAGREQEAKEQAAREQAEREQVAREQVARDQAAAEQAAREAAAREQAAAEQAAREQAAAEQAAREQAAKEEAVREAAAREQAAKEQAAREQAAIEQAAREQAAAEQAAREQAAKEQVAREAAAREQAAKEQAAREQAAIEQAAREQAAAEQAAREQAAKEQVAREAAAREQAAIERAAREQAAAEQAARASFRQRRNPILSHEMPALPNAAEIASGHVWPPVKGRASVSVAMSGRISVSSEVQPWAPADAFELVSDAGWHLHSSPRWLYDSESVARHRLLVYVRGQISRGGGIPEGRTLAVAKDGDRWRLWLLTPHLQPLSQRIIDALGANDPATTSVSMKEVVIAMRELRDLGLGGKEIAAGIAGLAMHERKLAVLPLDEGDGEPRLEPREPFAELVDVIGASVATHAALRRWFEDEGRVAIERASAQ